MEQTSKYKSMVHSYLLTSIPRNEKSALGYEVELCILTGDIVWINGPFPASYHDIRIFRSSLMSHLEQNKRVEADDGYVGEAPRHVKCPKCISNPVETEAMQQRKISTRRESLGVLAKFVEAFLSELNRETSFGEGHYFGLVLFPALAMLGQGSK